ncbi:right-handed parallel beta-helix repeat-containing protein [Lichenifustis flavocetrariae]|uniref:Right-handed parallel beta-helix repeat-containing protein n=1 Tax=Lichenifustis flavocetrariae TaxID=2949735 RepID=A0AA41YU50_9HYPH|nr:right-handed parallel beta-helix repeat-containing protein [Lichenifustis flavocetrariae]MCW6508199.1 right-handed parallel beta-helix repeat-containing protein [Lichenifustis flavocetrariae]
MRLKSLVLAAAVALLPVTAQAVEVYPGCGVPSTKVGAHTFYVDPLRGSDSGDGSSANPWKTLSTILGVSNKFVSSKAWSNKTSSYAVVNPTGPIKAGDTVLLRSGNHGNLKILNLFNDDFITVAAAPGATPVITQLAITSAAKWAFHGIKFQSPTQQPIPSDLSKKPLDALVTVGGGDYTGVSHDFVLYDNSFSTTDDTAGWSKTDWVAQPTFMLASALATCSSFVDNRFYNAFNALGLFNSRQIALQNSIRFFVNDGIDLTAGAITIKANTITDNVNSTLDGYHADGIQGWSNIVNGVPATNSYVTIDGNTIVKTGDAAVTYMQGISFFDGRWDHLFITNNKIITNTVNGIAVFGGTNVQIINNTLVASGTDKTTILRLQNAKDGTSSVNVTVRNNISPFLAVAIAGVTADHNIIAGGRYIDLVNGVGTNVTTSNMTKRNILVSDVSSLFVTVNDATATYDLRLKAGSAAVGFGSWAGAPATDIVGRTRGPAYDLGAYAYPKAQVAGTGSASGN